MLVCLLPRPPGVVCAGAAAGAVVGFVAGAVAAGGDVGCAAGAAVGVLVLGPHAANSEVPAIPRVTRRNCRRGSRLMRLSLACLKMALLAASARIDRPRPGRSVRD